MIQFDVRIDFFRELPGTPEGYVGSALKDGLRAVVLPGVGEYLLGLEPSTWHTPTGEQTGGPYSIVYAIEHALSPAFVLSYGMTPDRFDAARAKAEQEEPSVTVIVRALWPGDQHGELDLRDYDRQGWRLHFFSDHSAVQPFPGQPLMGPQRRLDAEGGDATSIRSDT